MLLEPLGQRLAGIHRSHPPAARCHPGDRPTGSGDRAAARRPNAVVDSSTFVILTELADGIEDPRPAIPGFLRFLEQLKGWVDGPPVIEHLDVVGSYNLFGTQPQESAVR
jgi:hypothetical protein